MAFYSNRHRVWGAVDFATFIDSVIHSFDGLGISFFLSQSKKKTQDRQTSLRKSNNAMPILIQEAIQSQSSNVDSVSGASYTSNAFNQSLASALAQAKI